MKIPSLRIYAIAYLVFLYTPIVILPICTILSRL